jgi:tetratricopeptide (TPR) repeat protein
MIRLSTLLLASLATAAVATAAQSATTVLGGGLAEACFRTVKAGQADRPAHELCTNALETEALRRRDRAGTYVNRGIVSLRMRSLDPALADFAKAERLNPLVGEIYVNRGAALISKAQFAEAVTEIDRGIALGVDEPQKAYYNRALAKEGLDDMKGAYFDYRKAIELDPAWTLPQNQMARFTVTTRR